MVKFSEVVMFLRLIPPNNHFFNPQIENLLCSLVFQSILSTYKSVRLRLTWQFLKKYFFNH